jgi:hypothetical protein
MIARSLMNAIANAVFCRGRAVAASFVLAALCASVTSCSNPPNTQILPIGSRCTSDSECGTSPYTCETTNYPNGYCDKTCGSDTDCPSDSVCYVNHCRRTCATASDCRQAEGYVCRMTGTTTAPVNFCDVPEGS